MAEMNEKPILFSAPMVKAILSGEKTQTRRVIKNPEKYERIRECAYLCPYGEVGSHLWCREGFWTNGAKPSEADFVIYHLEHELGSREISKDREGNFQEGAFIGNFKRYPSIFMPRWASRITLELTDIKVERIADISKEDAKAEGIEGRWHPEDPDLWTWKDYGWHCERFAYGSMFGARESFFGLWDSINAKRGFGVKANPFVFVIGFKRIK